MLPGVTAGSERRCLGACGSDPIQHGKQMALSTSLYAPSTFEERGAAVSFTTPALAQARVRNDNRSRLEVLLPSLSEGKGIYVLPWRGIPDFVTMTIHDRFLHGAIQKEKGCTPADIRKATMQAACMGLAGPTAVASAKKILKDEEDYRALTNYLLLHRTLQAVGLDARSLLKEDMASEVGQKTARALMAKAAAPMGIPPADLYQRLTEMADILAPVGLEGTSVSGRLRRQVCDLETLCSSLKHWAADNPSDTAPVAMFCAEVAQYTLEIARNILNEIVRHTGDIKGVMLRWGTESVQIRSCADRLCWLLDGWEFIIQSWIEVQKSPVYDQAMTIDDFFRIIPLVPKAECDRDMAGKKGDTLSNHRRSVRAYEDWRTGKVDVDAIRRIEKVKAKAL